MHACVCVREREKQKEAGRADIHRSFSHFPLSPITASNQKPYSSRFPAVIGCFLTYHHIYHLSPPDYASQYSSVPFQAYTVIMTRWTSSLNKQEYFAFLPYIVYLCYRYSLLTTAVTNSCHGHDEKLPQPGQVVTTAVTNERSRHRNTTILMP